jgi:hypothetical protein
MVTLNADVNHYTRENTVLVSVTVKYRFDSAVIVCRLWAYRSQDTMGKSSDDLLRHPGDSPDAAVPIQHRRRHGAVLPVPVLASLLLRLHQEAEERAVEAGKKYAG